MYKSFGYDAKKHEFRIARHEVGDFGLHLAIIRSFSWGDNYVPESPFFPGSPLPYHYYVDYLVGTLERYGVPIGVALNGISAIFFTALLFFIYQLPQRIFGKDRFLGILCVLLFLLPSTLTFVAFLKSTPIDLSIVKNVWMLPDYIHKGPFDGSTISIYSTLNPYLNQRHLIVGMAISLYIIGRIITYVLTSKKTRISGFLILGLIAGGSFRIHSLLAIGTGMVVVLLLVFYRRFWPVLYFLIPFIIILAFHMYVFVSGNSVFMLHTFFNPGYLSIRPLTIDSFIDYWWQNLGIALLLLPVGFLVSSPKQQKIFLAFLSLFILANIFQLSYRIEHNHSFINLFVIGGNVYVAYALITLFRTRNFGRIFSIVLFVLLTSSGVLNLMAVKNDFQFRVSDAPTNRFMGWIRLKTDRRAVFLSWDEQYDPVTLSGRRSYIGHPYYTTVMGYDVNGRTLFRKKIYETQTNDVLAEAKERGIDYIVLPRGQAANFSFVPNYQFFASSLGSVYEDGIVLVYAL